MSEHTVKLAYVFGHSIILGDEQTYLASAQPTIVFAVKLYWHQVY